MVQYQYLRVGLNLAKIQFNDNIAVVSKEVKETLGYNNKLTFLIGEAIKEDHTYFNLGVDSLRNASSYFLNDYLTEKLVNHGIDADFTYEIKARDATYYLKSPVVFKQDEDLSTYPIALTGYLSTTLDERVVLELKFKNLNRYFLGKLNGLTLPSLLFIIGIIITVIWVLRTFYWQRNIITTTNEFINNLTHELKTPVFSIGLASKILEEEQDGNPKIQIIRNEVGRLKLLIDKVLELGKLESIKNVFQLKRVDFYPIMIRLSEEFKTLSQVEEMVFVEHLANGPYWLEAEATYLESAIINLLDNAKKYSKNPEISLRTYKLKNRLVVEIIDNGRGIAEKDKNRIFQKYYRVLNTDEYSEKGYGLGLSYVKKVVLAHKGRIKVESKIGEGTKVSLEIPLVR